MMLLTLASLAERFAWFVDGLRKGVAADGARLRLDGLLVITIWDRVGRLGRRFASVVARYQAGTLEPPGAAGGRARTPRAEPAAPAEAHPYAHLWPLTKARLPYGFGWLQRLLPPVPRRDSAGGWAGELHYLLTTPAMATLVAEAPQAGRSLRPLCHILGVRPPEYLRLPRRVRRPRSSPRSSPRPSPRRGEGEGQDTPHPPAARAPPSPSRGEGKVEELSFTYSPPGTIKPAWMKWLDERRERRMRALFRAYRREKRGEG